MKIDLYYCSKPLQYLNLCNIPDLRSKAKQKYLLIYGSFYGAEEFAGYIGKYDKRWDKVILCESRTWFFNLLHIRVNNFFSPIDSSFYGILHFFFRFRFYLYEEGAGTYRKLYIQKKYRWASKIFGTGIEMGHSKYLRGIIVYHPQFYIDQISPNCHVFKFENSYKGIIRKESNLLFKVYEYNLLQNVKVSGKKILLYITDWDYDDKIVNVMLSMKKEFDVSFIKPHPHRKKEDLPKIEDIIPIYSSIVVEALLQFWIDNHNEITVLHQGSTAVIPFGNDIVSINMNNAPIAFEYNRIIQKLTELELENKKPKDNEEIVVSVCVPIYKVEKYIGRCVISLMEQTLQNIQFIFVDDCSPDRSIDELKKVLSRYPQRLNNIQIVYNKKNNGLATTRNIALNYAKGKYLAFVDSDDWLELDALGKMSNFMSENSLDIAYSDYYIDDGKTVRNSCFQRVYANHDSCVRALLRAELGQSNFNKMYRRQIIIDSNIRFVDGADMAEDRGFNCRLFTYAKKIAKYQGKPYYHYFVDNSSSITSNIFSSQNIGSEKFWSRARQSKANSDAIIQFLQNNGWANKYEMEIYYQQLASRSYYLYPNTKESLQKWMLLEPESNAGISIYYKKTIERFFVALLGKGLWRPYWIYRKMKDHLKSLAKIVFK